jgi:hypothetical protein
MRERKEQRRREGRKGKMKKRGIGKSKGKSKRFHCLKRSVYHVIT